MPLRRWSFVAIALGTLSFGLSRLAVAQTPAPNSTAAARDQILASPDAAQAWLDTRLGEVRVLDAQRRQALAPDPQDSAESWSLRVVDGTGSPRASVRYSKDVSTPGAYRAAIELVGADGAPRGGFAVVPYSNFAASADGHVIAFGNRVDAAAAHGDLHTHLVFYDTDGRELSRDPGSDLSPIRSLAILDEADLFVLGNPERIVAWHLSSGERAWNLPLVGGGHTTLMALEGRRLGAVTGAEGNARFLLIDEKGEIRSQSDYQGRPAPSVDRMIPSRDGTVMALGDIVGDSLGYRIVDLDTGEVLRELR